MNRFRATLGLVGSVGVFLLRRYRPRKCMKILLHIGGLAVGARQLAQACNALNLVLHDHLILGSARQWISLRVLGVW